MMVVEHLLIALKVGIMVLVDDVPQWMQESLARDRVREEQERLSALFGASNNTDDTSAGPESAKKDDTRQSSEGGSFVPNFTGLVSPNGLSRAFSNFNESTPPSTPINANNDTSNNNTNNNNTMSGNRSSLPASLPSLGNRRGSSLMKGINSLTSRLDRSFVSEQLAAEENLLGKPTGEKKLSVSVLLASSCFRCCRFHLMLKRKVYSSSYSTSFVRRKADQALSVQPSPVGCRGHQAYGAVRKLLWF